MSDPELLRFRGRNGARLSIPRVRMKYRPFADMPRPELEVAAARITPAKLEDAVVVFHLDPDDAEWARVSAWYTAPDPDLLVSGLVPNRLAREKLAQLIKDLVAAGRPVGEHG